MQLLHAAAVALATLVPLCASASSAPKRGLVFTPNPSYPQDNAIWVRSGSTLTWYYNYESQPSPAYASLPQEKFEFVPMMWGVTADLSDTTFLKSVQKLVKDGVNITHVMGFNEPDGPWEYGGSDIPPANAAKAWVANFIPLQNMGIKLGLPACTGAPGGLPWLKQFIGNCSEIISANGEKRNCTYDFLPVHWYDNFGGLASHIGERVANFPGTKIWITEYAYAHQELKATQEYYKMSAEYFDRLEEVERYTYFGAFRSKTSNVGPNASFLNNDGQLTDIGAWYLGFPATGVDPQSGNKSSAPRAHISIMNTAAALLSVLVVMFNM